jgi:hypothetical protein
MAAGYRILDEPRPGALANAAVSPVWPLLAVMFGGAWLSWPWFAFNAYAIGSPTRRRELAIAAGGFVGTAGLVLALLLLADSGWVEGVGISYALVVLVVWKLLISYWLYVLQGRTFALFEHFAGSAKNGLPVVFLGYFLGRRLLSGLDGLGGWGEILEIVLR